MWSFSRVEGDGGGGKEQLSMKTSAYAHFRGRRVVAKSNQSRKQARMLVFKGGGWWWWQRTTALENKRVHLFSREKGDGGKEQPASKTSIHARFRGRREAVVAKNNCPRKQVYMLVFEGEGWWWWWQRVTLKNEHMRSFSREEVVVLGNGTGIPAGTVGTTRTRTRTGIYPPGHGFSLQNETKNSQNG